MLLVSVTKRCENACYVKGNRQKTSELALQHIKTFSEQTVVTASDGATVIAVSSKKKK